MADLNNPYDFRKETVDAMWAEVGAFRYIGRVLTVLAVIEALHLGWLVFR